MQRWGKINEKAFRDLGSGFDVVQYSFALPKCPQPYNIETWRNCNGLTKHEQRILHLKHNSLKWF